MTDTSPSTDVKPVRHRCDTWQEIRIHPESTWLWGTCMLYYPKMESWYIVDEKSETATKWLYLDCPYCKADLAPMLEETKS